jgi:hypothetical protein
MRFIFFCERHGIDILKINDIFIIHGLSRRDAKRLINLHIIIKPSYSIS